MISSRLLRLGRRSPFSRYAVAGLSVVSCAAVWAYAAPHVEFELTLLLLVAPVLVGAWFGGRGPGLLAIVLSLASARLLMPFETSASGLHGNYLDLLLFAVEGALIVSLTGALRQARDEAEASSRSKEMFIAMVSHELRTPLNVMSGWVWQMQRRPADPLLLQRGLNGLQRTGQILTRLIEDLADVSRGMSGKLALKREPMPLMPIVASAVDDIRPAALAKGVEMRADISTRAVVDADAVRLTQVFSNLLVNAVKFTPEGGRIDIDATDAGDRVRVTVNDTGPGIPPRALRFIFEPFRQVDAARDSRAGGLGLGLAIAKQVVDLHGGRIIVERGNNGRGSRFVVELAVARESTRSRASEGRDWVEREAGAAGNGHGRAGQRKLPAL
jgi:signal transduction histidine kinase